jgi:DNA gyrase subunit B
VRVGERETSAANYITVPADLLSSPIYGNVRRAHAKLREIVGTPGFTLQLKRKEATADTFSELRDRALELAKEGMQVSRFKGLGEMNPSELWDTTMDPARRMLVRVEVEDAATADLIFSTLMGDQVEPRREFIEQNAKDVRFLDV